MLDSQRQSMSKFGVVRVAMRFHPHLRILVPAPPDDRSDEVRVVAVHFRELRRTKKFGGLSLVELVPDAPEFVHIRAACAFGLGMPILGDRVYHNAMLCDDWRKFYDGNSSGGGNGGKGDGGEGKSGKRARRSSCAEEDGLDRSALLEMGKVARDKALLNRPTVVSRPVGGGPGSRQDSSSKGRVEDGTIMGPDGRKRVGDYVRLGNAGRVRNVDVAVSSSADEDGGDRDHDSVFGTNSTSGTTSIFDRRRRDAPTRSQTSRTRSRRDRVFSTDPLHSKVKDVLGAEEREEEAKRAQAAAEKEAARFERRRRLGLLDDEEDADDVMAAEVDDDDEDHSPEDEDDEDEVSSSVESAKKRSAKRRKYERSPFARLDLLGPGRKRVIDEDPLADHTDFTRSSTPGEQELPDFFVDKDERNVHLREAFGRRVPMHLFLRSTSMKTFAGRDVSVTATFPYFFRRSLTEKIGWADAELTRPAVPAE